MKRLQLVVGPLLVCLFVSRHDHCEHVLPFWSFFLFKRRRGTRNQEREEGGHGVRRKVWHASWTGEALRVEEKDGVGSGKPGVVGGDVDRER